MSSKNDLKAKTRCGYCNGVMNQSAIELGLSKTCSVCGSNHLLRPKCAHNLVARATGAPVHLYQEVDKKTMSNTDVDFHCTTCKEKCFYCNKAHTIKSKFILKVYYHLLLIKIFTNNIHTIIKILNIKPNVVYVIKSGVLL